MAYSPDGSTLYAAVNGQNTVVAIDPATGAIEQTWAVGIAPRQLRFVGTKLYVSDEGGRQASPGEPTQGSYGTQVPADPFLGTSTTGALSTIDTANAAAPVGQIEVGLHPTAMYADDGVLYVANTNDDTVSVVDTATDDVVQTIATQPWQGSEVGYAPDAITVQGGRLLVSLGRANAIAVYKLGESGLDPVSYIGLVPTDYYPEDIFPVGDQLVVANRRGIDARGPLLTFNQGFGTTPATGHGTHGTTASLTRFTLPTDSQVSHIFTPTVFAQNGWGHKDTDVAHAHGNRHKAVPVPKRIGDPSTIKHVFMLVKENRTYDQIQGDMPEGNGDASLAQFGQEVTPNIHALSRQFGLYDNVYDIGTNSAEGHNWLMQGDDPEYTESSAGEYTRSYDTEEDVLGHQRSGFLWTAVQQAGNTAKNYGEFEYTEGKPSGTWQEYYCAARSVESGGDPAQLTTPNLKGDYGSVIPSLNDISNPLSPPFDMGIPDLYRYQIWKQDFEPPRPGRLQHDVALGRPHGWAGVRALGRRRRRPGAGQDRPDDLAQQVLEGLRDLHRRGRQSERCRPRRRPPRPDPGHQPLGRARQDHLDLLLPDLDGAHHRADPGRRAAEPEGRRRDADVRRVPEEAGQHAVHGEGEPHPAHREHRDRSGLRTRHSVEPRAGGGTGAGQLRLLRGGVGEVGEQAAPHRQARPGRLRQP